MTPEELLKKHSAVLYDQLEWADRLARALASKPCENPVDDDIDCGDVFVCGGICDPCWARKYTDRYRARATRAKA